jgi:hypothetical protein
MYIYIFSCPLKGKAVLLFWQSRRWNYNGSFHISRQCIRIIGAGYWRRGRKTYERLKYQMAGNKLARSLSEYAKKKISIHMSCGWVVVEGDFSG